MPTYVHKCYVESCEHRWNQVYGMTEDPPTVCPNCGTEGKVERLISGGSGPGIMRKTGKEVKRNLGAEIKAMRERARTDEKFRANLVGDEEYNRRVIKTETLEKELLNIGKKASTVKSTDVKPSTTRPKIKSKATK